MNILSLNNNFRYVEYMLKNGADPNRQDKSGKTPLMMACYLNDKEIISLLLDYKANMDIKGFQRVFSQFLSFFFSRVQILLIN